MLKVSITYNNGRISLRILQKTKQCKSLFVEISILKLFKIQLFPYVIQIKGLEVDAAPLRFFEGDRNGPWLWCQASSRDAFRILHTIAKFTKLGVIEVIDPVYLLQAKYGRATLLNFA